NGVSVLATIGLDGGNDLLVGPCGLVGFVVLLVANRGLIVFDRWFGGNAIKLGFSLAAPTSASSSGIAPSVTVNPKGGVRDLNSLRDGDLNDVEARKTRMAAPVSFSRSAQCAYPCPGERGSHNSNRVPSGSVAQPNRP